jgi:hypothetical protein
MLAVVIVYRIPALILELYRYVFIIKVSVENDSPLSLVIFSKHQTKDPELLLYTA